MIENKPETPEQRWWKTDAFLVAVVPVASLFFTYLYEAGYCWHFRIPWEFISPNWTNVFIVSLALLNLGMLLFLLINPLFMTLLSRVEGTIRRRLLRLSLPIILSLTYLILFPVNSTQVVAVSLMLAFFTILEFGLPLLAQKGSGKYVEKLAAQDAVDDRQVDLTDFAVRGVGIGPFGFLLFSYTLGIISYAAGLAAATKQEDFLIPDTRANSVVQLEKVGPLRVQSD